MESLSLKEFKNCEDVTLRDEIIHGHGGSGLTDGVGDVGGLFQT